MGSTLRAASFLARGWPLALPVAVAPVAVRAELPVPSANWIANGAAAQAVAPNSLTVRQYSDRATFNWDSFNIGPSDSVRFQQPAATSVALNRIHQADPSKILGSLSANGQVYLINRNGFLFGSGSQVNTHSLVVSSLDVTDETLARGLTKVIDDSTPGDPKAALVGDGRVYRVDATGRRLPGLGGQAQKIQVGIEAGARIATNAPGGRILIAAPSILNRGDVEASDGQVLMAAATDRVYLQEADPQSGVRGLLVEVRTGGDVTNLGRIAAARGNVTLAGFAVNQSGLASASTSVSVNGSIRLQAREGASVEKVGTTANLKPISTTRRTPRDDGLGDAAKVYLGSGSVTEVSLDPTGGTAVDEQAQPRSRVEIMARDVTLARQTRITAPSGEVAVTATEQPDSPFTGLTQPNKARIHLAPGSSIDVAGTRSTVLPMSRNILSLELRSNELRDSPLQKGGVLDGATVRIDARTGTSIADISGALARIQRTVEERSTTGGSVRLLSEGDALLAGGAEIDLSGGSVTYEGGYVETTKLWSKGRLYDIATADPDRPYDGVFGTYTVFHERWNVRESWKIPGPLSTGNYEDGYVQGFDAGELDIKSSNVVLEATILADAIDGLLQRKTSDRAQGGRLALDSAWTDQVEQRVLFRDSAGPAVAVGAADPFPRDEAGQPLPLVIGQDRLTASGLQHVAIATPAAIEVDSDMAVRLPAGGSFELTGGEVRVAGSISVPGGRVALKTLVPPDDGESAATGAIAVESGAVVNVAGRWVNDQPMLQTPAAYGKVDIDGGTVMLAARGDLTVAPGSLIDAGGGAWLQHNAEVSAGTPGTIALSVSKPGGSAMTLAGELRAYGLMAGGTLELAANSILIGSEVSAIAEAPHRLSLDPALFSQGGLGRYSLTANAGDLALAPGASVRVRTGNVALIDDYLSVPTGTPFRGLTVPTLLRDDQRAPAHLALSVQRRSDPSNAAYNVAPYDPKSSLTVGRGAQVIADPGAEIRLSSDARLGVDGVIRAPAGTVALHITAPDRQLEELDPRGFQRAQAIVLGPAARLLAGGSALIMRTIEGLRQGDVMPGGDVRLTADRGYIVTQPGSVIDVAGTAAVVDLPEAAPYRSGQASRAAAIASAGGNVALTAAEGMVLAGELRGHAGPGVGAAGGSLSIQLNNLNRALPNPFPEGERPYPNGRVTIDLKAQQPEVLGAHWRFGDVLPTPVLGNALVSADSLNGAGFSSLELKALAQQQPRLRSTGTIRFSGNLVLRAADRIQLDAPTLAWSPAAGTSGGNSLVVAPYVVLGSTEDQRVPNRATAGSGELRIAADNIDLVGAAALRGFRRVELAANEDVRLIGTNPRGEANLRGELVAGGDIAIAARQIYPTTLSEFRIKVDAVVAPQGSVRLSGSGGTDTPAPLSAAATLRVDAPHIAQAGVLKAPLGEIHLTAGTRLSLEPGSLTSTSARGTLIPFGRTQGGLDWLYPFSGGNRLIEESPEQRIALQGERVDFRRGATLDIAGGGDLYAYEAIPGPGGSVDRLDPADPGFTSGPFTYEPSYAVLPSLGHSLAPYDPLEFPASGLKAGSSLYLSGGGGLPAGTYPLLPAHYALLPGAFLLTPQKGTQDAVPGRPSSRVDGTPVIAGYRVSAGSGERDTRWSGFAVERGSLARTRTDYEDQFATRFFPAQAERQEVQGAPTPADAGAIAVAVEQALTLHGTLRADPAEGGQGSRMDITADRLAVVGRNGGPYGSGWVTLPADDLNALGVESLLLGGVRTREADGTRLDIRAEAVAVGSGATLQRPELLLAARDHVELAVGSRIRATGMVHSREQLLELTAASTDAPAGPADGALLRISTGRQLPVVRDGMVTERRGTLHLAAGSMLETDGALLLDASREIHLDGVLRMHGGSLSLGSARIGLGEAPDLGATTLLSGGLLNSLHLDELILRSRSSVDLYGDVAVQAGRIAIESGGLSGWGTAAQTASISADTLYFGNPAGAVAAAGSGGGQLTVAAGAIELGSGSYALTGFWNIRMNASGTLIGRGEARLRTDADLFVSAGLLTGVPGSTLSIDASGHTLEVAGRGPTPAAPAATGVGAGLNLIADALQFNAQILMPAGIVSLRALNGELRLDDDAVIDVAGRDLNLGNQTVSADAGQIRLAADRSAIRLASGAILRLAGTAGGGEAGSLDIASPYGSFELRGLIDAHGPGDTGGGSFTLDTGTLGAGGFSALNDALSTMGFDMAVAVRQRRGDLLVERDDVVRARRIALSADAGRIDVAGALDATAPQGGRIELSAGQQVRLQRGAVVLAGASALGESGGTVSLSAVDGTGADAGVIVAEGARIDVSGAPAAEGGSVLLRADRLTHGVAATVAEGTVTGAAERHVEAVRRYDFQGSHSITAQDIARWQLETASYMCPGGDCSNVPDHPVGFTLLPGLEVRATGKLSLDVPWDLWSTTGAWRYTGGPDSGTATPGTLTLRAGGALVLNASLSDGFANADQLNQFPGVFPRMQVLQPGESWAYRLVAGADLGAADVMATVAPPPGNAADLTLARGVSVRTGTGDIAAAASGDIRLSDARSTIYTAGRQADVNPYGSIAQLSTPLQQFFFYGEYPIDGGDISLRAGGSVIGAKTPQLMSDWLVRRGLWGSDDPELNRATAWAIAFDNVVRPGSSLSLIDNVRYGFRQNVGALGGGDVTVTAGEDVRDLSIMIPTTGKAVGRVVDDRIVENRIEVNGGGDLSVRAGGDIAGGVFYVDKGEASLRAGGSVTGGTQYTAGPVFALGDAQIDVRARGGIAIGAVLNPFLVKAPVYTDFIPSYFSTYSAASAIRFAALGGKIAFNNDLGVLQREYLLFKKDFFGGITAVPILDFEAEPVLRLYPGSLDAYALNGGIRLNGSMNLNPSALGSLQLLARNDISTGERGDTVTINQSDTDPALLPSAAAPVQSLSSMVQRLTLVPASSGSQFDATLLHAAVPVHHGDRVPVRIVSDQGSVVAKDALIMATAKALDLWAGKDLNGVSLQIQNVADTDTSVLRAGRDIKFETLRDESGGVADLEQAIEIAGPGRLQVLAGRNIDLGTSDGIVSIGNSFNSALDTQGASLSLLAGLGAWQPDAALSGPDSPFAEGLASLGDATSAEQTAELLERLFAEIRVSAERAAGLTGSAKIEAYQRGYDAIAAVFPETSSGAGDISLFFSKIQTIQGGDIDLVVPGGGVNAGLARAFSGQKPPSELGIVVQREGAINAMIRDDFEVNQSRVFTLDGGDILVWSSTGDIDAGRGAKSAISSPSPITRIDALGNLVVEFPPTISGSGIRAQAGSPGKPFGDVILAAPRGIVDAGEAGIGGRNVTIAATGVIGASNIQAIGTTIGIPEAPVAVLPPPTAGSTLVAATGVAQQFDEGLGSPASGASRPKPQPVVQDLRLRAELLGFGSCSIADVRQGKPGCGQ